MKRLVTVLLVTCLAQSAAVGQSGRKKYEPPKVATPADFRSAVASPDAQTLADAKWFEVFKDEKLQDLIREALLHNYHLRAAVARVEARRAPLGITRPDQSPTVGGGANITTQRVSRDAAFTLPEPVSQNRSFGSVRSEAHTSELQPH